MRWAVPVGLGTMVVAATLVVPAVAASAGADLPERTAQELLTDLQGADVTAVQGTVVLDADLGLPSIPDLGGGGPYGSDLDAMSMLDGTTTMRVWASADGLRIAALGTMGETALVTDGEEIWIWSSGDNTASRLALPDGDGSRLPEHGKAMDDAAGRDHRAALAALTPEQLSAMVVEALEPTTEVGTAPATRVAGRPAYQLVLTPRAEGSLVGSVTIAIDAAERVPTRVTVTSSATGAAALIVGYTDVSFTAPDPSVFSFSPPAGATVEEVAPGRPAPSTALPDAPDGRPTVGEPQVVGEGWATVLAIPAVPGGPTGADLEAFGQDPAADPTLSALLAGMPRVTGDWGSGRLLSTNLLTVMVTDDGRTLIGAVDRATIEAAASTTR